MTRSILISSLVIALTVTFISVNSIASYRILKSLNDELWLCESAEEYEELEEKFNKYAIYLSFSIDDNALLEVRTSLSELIAFANAGSDDEAGAAKSRLYSRLEEQRRLSGLNFSSIF